jgi:hypothetical protein
MSNDDPIRDAAAWEVLESAANKVASRSRRYSLEQVCAQLGVDPDRVREREAQPREGDDHD